MAWWRCRSQRPSAIHLTWSSPHGSSSLSQSRRGRRRCRFRLRTGWLHGCADARHVARRLQRLLLRAAVRRALGLRGPGQPRRQGDAAQGGRHGQRAVRAAGLHRLHRRSDAHHRRPGRAAPAHGRVQGDRRRLEGQDRALHARRARRVARPRRGLQGILRRHATTPSTTRACTSSRSTTCRTPARRSATSSSRGSKADLDRLRQEGADRRADAPAAVRPGAASGTGPRATARRRSRC